MWIDTTDSIGYRISKLDLQTDRIIVASRHSTNKGTLFKYDFERNLIWEKIYPLFTDGNLLALSILEMKYLQLANQIVILP